jgi:hypothetical protein
MPPSTERPTRISERSPFTITLALIISVITGSVTAGAVWNSHKEAVTNHESRLQHVEKKMEDFASIKTDVAVIKALLERIERRQRYPNSNSPE